MKVKIIFFTPIFLVLFCAQAMEPQLSLESEQLYQNHQQLVEYMKTQVVDNTVTKGSSAICTNVTASLEKGRFIMLIGCYENVPPQAQFLGQLYKMRYVALKNSLGKELFTEKLEHFKTLPNEVLPELYVFLLQKATLNKNGVR